MFLCFIECDKRIWTQTVLLFLEIQTTSTVLFQVVLLF